MTRRWGIAELALAGLSGVLAGCADATTSAVPPSASPVPTALRAADPAALDATPAQTPADPGRMVTDEGTAQRVAESAPAVEPPQRQAARAGAAARDITFDDIKFEMKKEEPFLRSMLTPQIEALHGARIRIRGYMYPSFQQTGLTQFVLVRDNMECCFGPGAALYDCIYVEMEPGKSTDYFIRPVSVQGVFHIREWVLDGRHLAIYHMTAGEVR